MVYASSEDVQARSVRTLTQDELAVLPALLEDAAILIDNAAGPADGCRDIAARTAVSCRMALRALGDGGSSGVPPGAMQGSMSGLGYVQSWTMGSSGATGELYLSKADRAMLGCGNRLGCYSVVESLTAGLPPEFGGQA